MNCNSQQGENPFQGDSKSRIKSQKEIQGINTNELSFLQLNHVQKMFQQTCNQYVPFANFQNDLHSQDKYILLKTQVPF